jgi:hypothetical protein
MLSKVCDIELANHSTIVYFHSQYAVMRDWASFGQTTIGGGHFEGFRELVGSDFMEFDEVLRDKGSCCS